MDNHALVGPQWTPALCGEYNCQGLLVVYVKVLPFWGVQREMMIELITPEIATRCNGTNISGHVDCRQVI